MIAQTRLIALAPMLALLGGSALAQQPASDPPADRQAAIVNGRHIQPRVGDDPAKHDLPALPKVHSDLDKADSQTPVVPRDLYGNPIGGNPGLNPPGLDKAPPKPQ